MEGSQNGQGGSAVGNLIFLFSLKPIVLGLIGMAVSGFSFPIAGVIILNNGLIPMRYMLMHGVILGGTLAIAWNLPMVLMVMLTNILLVLLMMAVNRSRSMTLANASTAMMVSTMGLASLISHVLDVPSKDTLEVLWGSPFALTTGDIVVIGLLSVALVVYCSVCFDIICVVFFDKDIAGAMGLNVRRHYTVMVMMTALAVAVSMKAMGALLVDALLILPVLIAARGAQGLKQLFVRSSLIGLALSISGYIVALVWNLPVSGVLALMSAVLYGVSSIWNVHLKRRNIICSRRK